MKKYIKLYGKFVSQYLKFMMQSKVNFFIGFFGFLTTQATGIAFLYLVFQNIPSLNGWSYYEILFIYGFAQLPRGIDHLFTDYIWMMGMRVVVRGEFDRYLLRPINPLFHLISERFQPDAFGELAVGTVITSIAAAKLGIKLSFGKIIIFLVLILAGAVIYTAIKLFFATLAFWIKNSLPIMNLVYSMSDFAKYPNSIYSKFVQGVITIIIPFAFTAFIPASYFTGKTSLALALGGTVSVAIVSFSIAYAFWLYGIKSYESAGN